MKGKKTDSKKLEKPLFEAKMPKGPFPAINSTTTPKKKYGTNE